MIRLALRCRAGDAERVLAELLELAPGGIEEVGEPNAPAGTVEYAIYGAPGELPDLGVLRAAIGGRLVEVRSEPVPDDWSERWKRFYHPVLVGGRLYVRPPWERAAERGAVVEVVIDPGRAFGTGTHATTRLCLELLLAEAAGERGFARSLRRLVDLLRGRSHRTRSLCDLGTGSGVIAIAGAKLEFEPVTAIDLEDAAIAEADRNARANYVEIELRQGDLRQGPAPIADVVVANLDASLIQVVARGWVERDVRPATAIASGFLAKEAGAVSRSLAESGLGERERLVSGEWGALLARAE